MGLALGTMRLPAMLLIGMAAPAAGGTNILVGSLASLTGAIRHLREGRVNMRIVLIAGVPAFIGGFGAGKGPRIPVDLPGRTSGVPAGNRIAGQGESRVPLIAGRGLRSNLYANFWLNFCANLYANLWGARRPFHP